ncbi:universal stress protein [Nonomuraea africana]|uniref:Nucleotide-binding universal stress UspA family protein n=1 Tax=Nonomuraea africana TaxID=46171 RepID=A0ABR9KB47_9ACTN|nr:universal stress protein [Nonomuraea africana]MBE1559209.1 nucleotide-binding universal stress UspA family protein [Nonomuraea africana]
MSAVILVGTDGSEAARAAVEWAADDARRTGASLRVVHAVDRWPYQIAGFPPVEGPDTVTRNSEKVLEMAVVWARARWPDVEVATEIIDGPPAAVLREQGRDAAEIVVGSRGLGGFAGALLGSVSMHVAGHARCPVVVVRPGQVEVHGEIVVGVDESRECEPALAYAFEQARLRDCLLRVLYAWRTPRLAFATESLAYTDQARAAHRKLLIDRIAAFETSYPQVTAVEQIRHAHPVDALTDASATADLVVVGSHGRGAMTSAVLGSVSRGVLHHARCAVAVVRS